MAIDWKVALKQAVDAGIKPLTPAIPEVKGFAKEILEASGEQLEQLTRLRAEGLIDKATFENEVKALAEVTEAELLALRVFAKAAVQGVINRAVDVLIKSGATALRGLIGAI